MLLDVETPGCVVPQLDRHANPAHNNTATTACRRLFLASSQKKGSNNTAARAGISEGSMVSVVIPVPATVAGENTHRYAFGNPLAQWNVTVPLHAPIVPTVRVTGAPAALEPTFAKACSVKSGPDW
jgi:hypothetical protein